MKSEKMFTVLLAVVMICTVAAAQEQGEDEIEIIESHLGNEGPAYAPGMTPSLLEWGPDDRAYPSRFVVYPKDGSELVWVPAGEFTMGSTDDDNDAQRNEKPAQKVRISQGFWLGRHEITNDQFKEFCAESGYQFPEDSDQGGNHPVVYVNWEDAAAYCRHYGFNLPTEAQWEYAARGPQGRIFPWGNEWDPARLCWRHNQGPGRQSFPVGSFPAGTSWCGVLDMAGNVWEWCNDWYERDYYMNMPQTDPQGAEQGDQRVIRGGGWGHNNARFFRGAYRYSYAPLREMNFYGFRVVLQDEPAEE